MLACTQLDEDPPNSNLGNGANARVSEVDKTLLTLYWVMHPAQLVNCMCHADPPDFLLGCNSVTADEPGVPQHCPMSATPLPFCRLSTYSSVRTVHELPRGVLGWREKEQKRYVPSLTWLWSLGPPITHVFLLCRIAHQNSRSIRPFMAPPLPRQLSN